MDGSEDHIVILFAIEASSGWVGYVVALFIMGGLGGIGGRIKGK